MLGKPKFSYGQKVKTEFGGREVKGIVYVVDAYGTFEQTLEPSYDILDPKDNCLYKHIEESAVIEDK